jgi:hypothetical protein
MLSSIVKDRVQENLKVWHRPRERLIISCAILNTHVLEASWGFFGTKNVLQNEKGESVARGDRDQCGCGLLSVAWYVG